ncbi:MAG: Druantia anti-phage system protein DruA [Desulfitobacteriaceae bacterium]
MDFASLIVRPINTDERELWDELMNKYHYLGFRKLVGESIRYIVLLQGKTVALLGWSSAAYKSLHRDQWIGWSEKRRHQRLTFVANNSRFLILPYIRIKNLASKILSLNVKRLSADWQNAYSHPIVLAETFIDHHRFFGTCYRAAGWLELGQTRRTKCRALF